MNRKRTGRLVTLAGVALLSLPCFCQSTSTAPSATEVGRDWGPIEKGLRVSAALEQPSYAIGKEIVVRIAVENVSANVPIYGEPFHPRPAFNNFAAGQLKVTVQDEDGPLPKRWDPGTTTAVVERFGGPSLCPPPVLQGKPVLFEKKLGREGLLPRKPGTYKITVEWASYTTDASSCDAVRGIDWTKTKIKPYAIVSSNPVFVEVTGESAAAKIPEYTAWKEHFALVDTSFGEKTALLDKRTNLEWLRLSVTAGLPYDKVKAQTAVGGEYAGWRFATEEELRQFFADFTGSPNGKSHDEAIERKLQRLLGGPLNEVSNDEGWHREDSYGFVGDPAGPDNNMTHYHAGYLTDESGGAYINPASEGSVAPGFAPSGWGSFLVREH